MMQARIGKVVLLSILTGTALAAEPIKPHPANPHYYLYRGQPTILITSAEHYGAVINRAFDYVPYLDTLKAHGLNYTRPYAGAMFETIDKFITGNPLGPKPRDLVAPWARSNQPGYLVGGNKFDLDQWNPEYFARLKDYLSKAGERGIVVEICFFNSQYSDTWPISPLYYENNVQGVGKCDWRDAQTLKHADLVRREADYVRKITQEVNSFDNVILEICDEAASVGTGIALAGPWVSHLMDTVKTAERDLPKKHMIAQEVEGPFGGPMDFSADPRLSIITAQYIWGGEPDARGGEMGGMRGLDYKYSLNKPIELNETDWYPWGYRGDKTSASRVEAWEFIVGGGAGFNHLNGLFTPQDPGGKSAENEQLLGALQNLTKFMYSFDFLKMRPDRGFVVSGLPSAATFSRAISEPGKQYALYIHHSQRGGQFGSYEAVPGSYHEDLTVSLPRGDYQADWVDPARGVVMASESFAHDDGNRTLATPSYTIDIALRIKRK
ncbi:MAG: hypothetical protein LAP39_18625 [Acidobacteriia bacterium]|nr:hypothetical protein [Terriglobia bacterium]